ncbi:MAG TPA: hypothetical protein PL196_02935 [Burkholderiaceae bacterium]|nr:hypothetical protein [Burkholderiaceae bacterium]
MTRSLWPGALALAALVLGLATGCGGSDSDTSAPPPVGDPVSATIGSAGGSIAFTASGAAGSLEFPAGALASDTLITVTPLAPDADAWARLRIDGADALLETPATLTLTLRNADSVDASAAMVVAGGESQVLLPAEVKTAERRISVPIHWLGEGRRVVPLAAQRSALPPFSPGELIFLQRLAIRARVTAAELQYQALVATNNFSAAFNLAQSIVALQQSSGLDGFEEDARPWLNRTKDSACAVLRTQIAVARGTPIATKDDFKRLTAPVMYWQAMVAKLGGEACAGLDPAGAIDAKLTESLRWVEAQTSGRPAQSQFPAIATPVRDGRGLMTEVTVLGTATVARSIDAGLVQPALAPVRTGAWAAAEGTTQDHYRPALAAFGAGTPLTDDLQLAGTSLNVGSFAGGSVTALGNGAGGRGASPEASAREVTVPARVGGRVDLSGPIAVLSCPNAANERLVITFEGVKVLDRPSVGDKLLDATQSFAISSLLAAAGIPTTTEGTHVLELQRVGSTCNSAFGASDAVLTRVKLDFLAGKPPPPSRITGRTFSGSMKEYYMPYDSSGFCSTSCLDSQPPGSDRCPVIGSWETTLSVTGDPSAYLANLRRRHSTVPPDTPVIEENYGGSGNESNFGGYLLGTPPGVNPYAMNFSVNESGALTGTIRYSCHLLEMSLAAPPN